VTCAVAHRIHTAQVQSGKGGPARGSDRADSGVGHWGRAKGETTRPPWFGFRALLRYQCKAPHSVIVQGRLLMTYDEKQDRFAEYLVKR
jgi:hypothetical protein